MNKIYLPAMVVFCGERLVATTPKGFISTFRFGVAPHGRLLCAHASLPKMTASHILDCRGFFHRLIPISKRYALFSWFAPVWDFTKMECDIETAGPLKVNELLTEAKNWKNESGQKMARFFMRQNPGTVFGEIMFRQAWEINCMALPESEWNKAFDLKS